MKAILLSFRRGRHHQNTGQLLLEIEGCDTRAKAAQYVGKRVAWTSPAGKQIFGKIAGPHGSKGVLRARFSRGLPGGALTKTVEILEKQSPPISDASRPRPRPSACGKAPRTGPGTSPRGPIS